jgi:hypothetical protein
MIKFIGKLVIFLCLVGIGLTSAYLYNPLDSSQKQSNDYLMAIIEKHQRLTEIKGNRIIFVGGSSVAFGTNSQYFGPKAYNLGLHAGLGISFMVKEIEHYARKGDLIIVSTEYFLDDGDKALLAYLINQVPEVESFLDYSDFDKIEMSFIAYQKNIQEKIKRIQRTVIEGRNKVMSLDVNTLYNRKGFNFSGDYINHLGKERPWGLFFRYTLEDRPYNKEISILNQLSKLQKKDIRVVYVFPSFADTEYIKNEKAILSFERQLRNGLLFPVIGSPRDFIYPENNFYDTAYHLTREGRKKRSETLVKLLQSFLPNSIKK